MTSQISQWEQERFRFTVQPAYFYDLSADSGEKFDSLLKASAKTSTLQQVLWSRKVGVELPSASNTANSIQKPKPVHSTLQPNIRLVALQAIVKKLE